MRTAAHRKQQELFWTISTLLLAFSNAWQTSSHGCLAQKYVVKRYQPSSVRVAFAAAPPSMFFPKSLFHQEVQFTGLLSRLSVANGDVDRFAGTVDDFIDDLALSSSAISSTKLPRAKFKKKSYLLLNDVSDLIAKNDPKAVAKAEEMVDRLESLCRHVDQSASTLTRGYNLWIHAIAKSGALTRGNIRSSNHNNHQQRRRSVGHDAETVLRRMQDRGVKPNLISYTSVMDAYARHKDKDAPRHAERLLFELLQAVDDKHSDSYNSDIEITSVVADTVINAWAQQGTWDGTRRALEILKRLELLSANSSCQPSIHSYAIVMHGLATCRRGREAAEAAEELLYRLLDREDATNLKPDVVVFNAAIHCWANSNDPQSGLKAMSLLSDMKAHGCQPDLVSYNTVLSAWSHSGHEQAGPHVEKLLKDMITAHQSDPESTPAPDTVSYNNVLHAWSKSELDGAVSRAEKVLRYMILADRPEISPDAYSFTSVLNALAKSKESDKVVRAQAILVELLELHGSGQRQQLTVSQVPFNAVLNAAAFSAMGAAEPARQQALKTAVETFKRMKSEGVDPDAVSYGNLMKCLVNLMPAGKSRTDMAVQVFSRCCEQGLVGDLVWNEAKKALPSHVLMEKVPLAKSLNKIRATELPLTWRRNVGRQSNTSAHARAKQQEEADRQERLRHRGEIAEVSYQSGRDL